MSRTAIPTTTREAATAILALIHSRPQSPRIEEIEAILSRFVEPAAPQEALASDIRIRLRKAMARHDEAFAVAAKTMGTECEQANAHLDIWGAEISALEAEIPNPPRCFEDLVARAEVARHGGDIVDGKLMEAEDEEDVFLGPAARLIEAVLQLGGADPCALSPAHAEHQREWDDLIKQFLRDFPDHEQAGMTKAEIEADEARMAKSMDVISALMGRIFAVPARTWGDVMLYARTFMWRYWPGVDLDGPEVLSQLESGPMCQIEDEDIAKLLGAIFTIAGIGHFAEARP